MRFCVLICLQSALFSFVCPCLYIFPRALVANLQKPLNIGSDEMVSMNEMMAVSRIRFLSLCRVLTSFSICLLSLAFLCISLSLRLLSSRFVVTSLLVPSPSVAFRFACILFRLDLAPFVLSLQFNSLLRRSRIRRLKSSTFLARRVFVAATQTTRASNRFDQILAVCSSCAHYSCICPFHFLLPHWSLCCFNRILASCAS